MGRDAGGRFVKTGFDITAKDGASKVFKRVSKTANRALKMIATASLAVAGAVAAAFAVAARAAIQFERSIAEVSTLVDSAKISNEELSASVLELSGTYGAAPAETARVLYQAISSGAEAGAEANKLLDVSFRLAVGGATDIFTAVDGLTTVINAYGVSMDAAQAISDGFFTTIKLGKTTAAELSRSIGMVASTAATAGVGLDELLGAIAAGSKVLGNTERIVTGLNQAMINISKPTMQAEEEIARLGLSMDNFRIKGDGLVGLLGRLSKSSQFGARSLTRLFESSQAQKAISALLTNDMKDFKFALDEVRNSAGASTEAFDKMSKTTGFLVDRAKSLVEILKITVGNLLKTTIGVSFLEPVNKALAISIAFFQQMSFDSGVLKTVIRALTKNAIVLAARGLSAMAKAAALTASGMIRLSVVAKVAKKGIFDIAAEIGKWESKTGAAVKVINVATGEVSDLKNTTKETSAAMSGDINRMTSTLERFETMAGQVTSGIDDLADELEQKIGSGGASGEAAEGINLLADTLTKLGDIINKSKEAGLTKTLEDAEEAEKDFERVVRGLIAAKEEELEWADKLAEADDREMQRLQALTDLKAQEAKASAEIKRREQRERGEGQQLRFDEVERKAERAGNIVGGFLGGAFRDLITKAKTFEEVAVGALKRIGFAALELALSKAFTLLFKLILGTGTGGGTGLLDAIFGGNRGGIVPMATGGLVGGGTPQNQDSQLIAATPGERILPVRETRIIDRGEGVFGTPQAVAAAAGPGAPSLTQNFNLFTIPTRVQMDRMNKESIQPSNRNLRRLGFDV